MGSPPRVREKHYLSARDSVWNGITPACAGKTFQHCQQFYLVWDHPRVCGKNLANRCRSCLKPGSPPRVREKLSTVWNTVNQTGITPACAGKTSKIARSACMSWDHPRVCGKNLYLPERLYLTLGSPPRVREKHTPCKVKISNLGITPACAGKTTELNRDGTLKRDHPRVCGKNLLLYYRPTLKLGSPPRVREKQLSSIVGYSSSGITPACAGKTDAVSNTNSKRWDHPRVCGKNC